MRLRQLDLVRYGKFTNYSVDIGESITGAPDFHIIYGLNEAGKSTALSAYLDLLFGIEHKSNYGFKHQYNKMEIGATLTLGGKNLSLLRNKSRKNSLRNGSGEPLDEGVILGELAGIGRDAYTTMFSLDDDSLEQGGESILSSEGHLGELLYSASSGVAGLTQRLDDLRDEVESFYKTRRPHQLGELLDELDELKEKRNAIIDKAEDYARLVSVRDSAQQDFDSVHKERTHNQQRLDKIGQLLHAKAPYDGLIDLNAQLAPLLALPEVPASWSQDLPTLEKKTAGLNQQRDDVFKRIAGLEKDLESITLNESVLQAQEKFVELEEARTRLNLSMEKEPELRNALQSLEHSIASVLKNLEQPADVEPARLRFNVSTVASLEEKIQSDQTLEMAVINARSELDKASRALVLSQKNLDTAAAETGINEKTIASMQELERAIAPYEGKGTVAELMLATTAHEDALDDLQRSLDRLRPWTGEIESLSIMTVPDTGTLTALDARHSTAQQAVTQAAIEITRLEDDTSKLQAQVLSIKQTVGVVNDVELVSLREQRNLAWTEHRAQLIDATADTFETLLKQDDLAQSAKILHADAVASLSQSTELLAGRQAELARAREKNLIAERAFKKITDELEQETTRISPRLEGMPVNSIILWLDERESALDTALKVKKLARRASDLQDQLKQAETTVQRALKSAGLTASDKAGLDHLLELARSAISSAQQLSSSQAKLEDCKYQVTNRQQDLDAADTAVVQWQLAWKALCSGSWLVDYDPLPEPETVKQILAEVRTLEPLLKQRDERVSALQALQQNQLQFQERMTSFGAQIDVSQDDLQTDEYFGKLQQQVKQALGADAERKHKLEQIETLQAEAKTVQQKLLVNTEMAETMYQSFGVSTLDAVRDKLQQVKEKEQLQIRAASELERLLEILSVTSLDEAGIELQNFDRAELEREQASIKTSSPDLDIRAQKLYLELQNSKSALNAIGSDNDAALLEEKRKVLELEILDRTRHYLGQKLGILAAERALNRYRDTHRSDMLKHASEAFATISRGAYIRLETLGTASAEKLVGITADGGSKDSGDMSKGTRFQLYLALRVAGYHEYVKTRPQLPFIADDIMETFDDERAGEAFRVFATMAGVGQVIYLTHHEHLCEIARSVCPTVNIHELNDEL